VLCRKIGLSHVEIHSTVVDTRISQCFIQAKRRRMVASLIQYCCLLRHIRRRILCGNYPAQKKQHSKQNKFHHCHRASTAASSLALFLRSTSTFVVSKGAYNPSSTSARQENT